MGLLDKLLGSSAPIDVLRADLSIEYHPLTSTGKAAVEWVYLRSEDPNLQHLRPALICLLYARILAAHPYFLISCILEFNIFI